MTTENLMEFLVLSQTLSFSDAAAKLYTTQSNLSRHIAAMEKELGVLLLIRTTHTVKLTREGKILAQRIPHLLQKSNSAFNIIRSTDIKTSGKIKISCPDGEDYGQLLSFFNYFSSKFKEIDLDITTLNAPNLPKAISENDFTFSCFAVFGLQPGIEASTVFSSGASLCIDAFRHDYNRFMALNLKDISGETLLVPYGEKALCSYGDIAKLALKETGGNLTIRTVLSVESAIVMASLGVGVAIVPSNKIKNTSYRVAALDIADQGCIFNTKMYSNKNMINPAAKLMAEELDIYLKIGG